MADHGVNFEFIYTGEVGGNISGGLSKKLEYLDNVDLTMDLDSEKLAGYKGGTLHMYGIGNLGSSPSEHIGDAQVASNIDGPDRWTLLEAWYQQNFFEDKLSVLAGLYDVASDFDALEYASLFINSSHGMSPTLSQTGISTFPTGAFGGRVKIKPWGPLYYEVAVLDAVPGDPTDDEKLKIHFSAAEGAVIINEVGILTQDLNEKNPYGKISLGGWYYTAKFDDLEDVDALSGDPIQHRGSYGLYALGEYQVYREVEDGSQGLGVYTSLGYADPKVNQFNYYIGAGAQYTGLIPTRDADQLGLALATVINGSKYKRVQEAAASPVNSAEYNLELTYRAQLTGWFAMQPDFQYMINPGMAPDLSNAFYIANRFEVSF
ncbi:MAG: carbohydrate porin [Deltaproteobacteria bacterium]|nr:MAG: carbohydrate porin [Deltaproteobacteria bacterium]